MIVISAAFSYLRAEMFVVFVPISWWLVLFGFFLFALLFNWYKYHIPVSEADLALFK